MHLDVFVARIRRNSSRFGKNMNKAQLTTEIKHLLIETLSLDITPEQMDDDALLLGDIPEFDSMAIVSVITALEENYQFTSADDELTAEVFESVETVVTFVSEHIERA